MSDKKPEQESSQEVHVGKGSEVGSISQTVKISLGIGIFAAIALIVAFGIPDSTKQDVFQQFFPTPLAISPSEGEGDSLIIVAEFQGEAIDDDQPFEWRIADMMQQTIVEDGLTGVRVAQLREVITNNEEAQQVGEVYQATLVIWGMYDGLDVKPRIERIGATRIYRSTEEGLMFSIAEPDEVAFTLRTALPTHASYLSLFVLGSDLYNRQENATARPYFTSAIELVAGAKGASTNPAECWFYLGNMDSDEEQYEAAIVNYDQAIELAPALAEAYTNRGVAYADLGEYDQAITDYTQAIELDHAKAYNNRGNVYCVFGEYDKAIADYNQGLLFDSKDAYVYNNRGNAYSASGEYEQAIADYNQALQLDHKDADVYNNRGITYILLVEYDKAIADFDQALKIDPEYAKAYATRGSAYTALGEYEQAVADFDQALELDHVLAAAYIGRGLAYKLSGNPTQAIADFRRGLELSEDASLRQIAEQRLRELGVEP